MWRGGFRLNISVSAPFVWRCLSGSALTPFPHPAHRTGQADFPHPACMGLSLSRSIAPFCRSLSFHSFVRPAPRAFFRPDRIFASPSRAAALLQRRGRLVLDGREHGGRLGRATIRGEPAIGRDHSREPRLYSVEPVSGPDHEAVIRFCGQGSEAAGPFSQRHCSHSRMRIAATSDRHRLPGASSAVRCQTLFVLSRSRVLFTPPAAVRYRPAPRRS